MQNKLKFKSLLIKMEDNPLINELEALKGPNAKIMGYDYYNVIIASCVALFFLMSLSWFILEDDPKLRNMIVG